DDREEVDLSRQFLVHLFDSAKLHCLDDSRSNWRPGIDELNGLKSRILAGDHFRFDFGSPAPIQVEGRDLLMERLWFSLRIAERKSGDWLFETPDGSLVALRELDEELSKECWKEVEYYLEDWKPKP
ncbi:MAG: hypothetical protein AAGH89_01635, partial [Verrucomicrobiota bacterium]